MFLFFILYYSHFFALLYSDSIFILPHHSRITRQVMVLEKQHRYFVTKIRKKISVSINAILYENIEFVVMNTKYILS